MACKSSKLDIVITLSLLQIAVDLHVSEEVEAVSVSLGEHLLLPCETGAVNPPTQSTWRKDGIEVTENIVGIQHAQLYWCS